MNPLLYKRMRQSGSIAGTVTVSGKGGSSYEEKEKKKEAPKKEVIITKKAKKGKGK